MPAIASKERIWRRLLGSACKHLRVRPPQPLPILEQLLYAICRRNCSRDLADAAFQRLRTSFSDWNEVRVSAVREVADALFPLPDAFTRAEQIIKLLQEVFESHYSFDLENFKKKPLHQVIKHLSRWRHADDFLVAWTLQYGLEAHAIPVDESVRRVVVRLGLVSEDQTLSSLQSALQRQVRKANAASVYEIFSALANQYCQPEPRCQDCCMYSCCPTARPGQRNAPQTLRRNKPR